MTVVINEFEVVPEPASTSEPAGTSEPAAARPPSAPDVEKVTVHLIERAMRVWAH